MQLLRGPRPGVLEEAMRRRLDPVFVAFGLVAFVAFWIVVTLLALRFL